VQRFGSDELRLSALADEADKWKDHKGESVAPDVLEYLRKPRCSFCGERDTDLVKDRRADLRGL
jgi:hypothetical protein